MEDLIELLTDPWYWWDSMPALLVAAGGFVIVLVVGGWLMALWNGILQFFSPSVAPGPAPTRPAPSPWARFTTCFISMIILGVLVVAAFFILFLLMR